MRAGSDPVIDRQHIRELLLELLRGNVEKVDVHGCLVFILPPVNQQRFSLD